MSTIDPTAYSWYRKNGEWVRCEGTDIPKTGVKTTTTNLDGTPIPLPEFEDPAESTHGYFTCYVFARSATTPDTPTGDTPASPPWYTIPQAGSELLWMSMAIKKQSVLIGEWSTPVCLTGEDGAPGIPGFNSATVYLYQRAASIPNLPTSEITYTFATGVAYGLTEGWVQYIPVGTNPVYVISAAAVSTESTDTIPVSDWTDPIVMAQNGSDGADGADGADGTPGSDGADAVIFSISQSVTSIVRGVDGVLSPTSILFSFFSKTGIAAPIAYSGRYKIYETINGIDWTLQDTAVADCTSIDYTPSVSTIFGIRCELYAAGGTITLFTTTTAMVVADATYDASDMTAWKEAIVAAGGVQLGSANTEGAVLNGLLAADQIGAGIITALIQILAPIIDLQGSGSENSMRLSADGLVIRNADGDIVCTLSTNGMSLSGVATISNDSDTVTIDSSGVHIGAKDDTGAYIGPNSQLLASVLQFLYGVDVRVEIGANSTHISKPLLSDGTVITDDLYLPDVIVIGETGNTTGDLIIRHSATITTIDFV